MKTVSTLFLLLFSIGVIANNNELNRLLNDREQQSINHQALVDSVINNKLNKLTLLNDNLQLIKVLDDSILEYTQTLLTSQETLTDSLSKVNARIVDLSLKNEQLQVRTKNDLQMLLIFKIALALLLVTILALIYFLVTKKTKTNDNTDLSETITSLEKEKELAEQEIQRLKSREINFKEELERGMQIHQEHYSTLTEKCNHLEVDNMELRNRIANQEINVTQDQNHIISQLTSDKDQLTHLKSQLEEQLNEAKAKNESIMRKISKLINDLAGVNA